MNTIYVNLNDQCEILLLHFDPSLGHDFICINFMCTSNINHVEILFFWEVYVLQFHRFVKQHAKNKVNNNNNNKIATLTATFWKRFCKISSFMLQQSQKDIVTSWKDWKKLNKRIRFSEIPVFRNRGKLVKSSNTIVYMDYLILLPLHNYALLFVGHIQSQ